MFLPLAIHLLLWCFCWAAAASSAGRLVRTARFGNVTLQREVVFTENSSLAEDVLLLDRLFEGAIQEKEQKHTKVMSEEAPRARVLLVGDHSLFEKFRHLYGEDEYAAYNGLALYLTGVFNQLQSLFAHLTFFDQNLRLRLELAGPPMVWIVLRPEDCPLRSPLLSALQQRLLASSSSAITAVGNFSSSAAFPPPNNSTSSNATTEPALDDSLSWARLDALMAVQWTSRWIRQSQREQLLPEHEHLLLITAMDLLSQLNDSSTQGMAYVRAICRGPDSVSDVGGLGTPTVAAHEMSHSLGAFHDGFGESENCSVRQNFLMAPISAAHPFDPLFGDTFANAFQLSACSKNQIEEFLNSSDSNCLWSSDAKASSLSADISAGGNSVQRSAARRADAKALPGDSGKLLEMSTLDEGGDHLGEDEGKRRAMPGERFPPGRQCQIAFGPGYGLCQRRDFLLLSADSCRRLWCKDRRQRRWAPCETKGFLPMLDGTRCGDNKWCQRGQCVQKPRPRLDKRAPDSRTETSPECVDLNGSFCLGFDTPQLRIFCPVTTFSRLCCASCKPFSMRMKGQKAVPKHSFP